MASQARISIIGPIPSTRRLRFKALPMGRALFADTQRRTWNIMGTWLFEQDWNVPATSQLDLIQPFIDVKATFNIHVGSVWGKKVVLATFKLVIKRKLLLRDKYKT